MPQKQSAEPTHAHVAVTPYMTAITGGLNAATLDFPVRVIADADIIENGELNPGLKNKVTATEWNFVRGLNLLVRAEEVNDSKTAEEAYNLLSPVLFGRTTSEQASQAVKIEIGLMSMKGNIGLDLEMLISHALSDLRVVGLRHWTLTTAATDRRSLRERRAIGLYCPDYKTAIAAKMILGNIRVCFRCKRAFIAKRPKQNCCSAECREAHRVARWRARKKKELELQKAVKVRSRKTQTHNTRRLR